jgi:hypothetical protein
LPTYQGYFSFKNKKMQPKYLVYRTFRDYRVNAMKRVEIARKVAAQTHVSRAEARDQVDEVVRKILKSLRKGRPVELPGVGRLIAEPPERQGRA